MNKLMAMTLLMMLVVSMPVWAGNPHTVCGKVFDAVKTMPADGTIRLKAYIAGRPDEILTEKSPGSGYQSGWFQVVVGNFPNRWKVGDVLIIEFTHNDTGASRVVEHILTSQDPEQIGDIVLQRK